MASDRSPIIDCRHPTYTNMYESWKKWRLVYGGGENFIEEYLVCFSDRETTANFTDRKNLTYCPAHAKSALNEVKNSIFQRLVDITRIGGPVSYQARIRGEKGGVDNDYATMTSFIGTQVLPELLSQGKVGVYVDMPENIGDTLLEAQNKYPYLYIYKAEEILSWDYYFSGSDKYLKTVLLLDTVSTYDSSGLPNGVTNEYRHLYINDIGTVTVDFYSAAGLLVNSVILNIKRIPFVIFNIKESLLKDIDNYQIALLNMESADVNYSVKSNFPFYTEQYDPRTEATHLKQPAMNNEATGTFDTANVAKGKEIKVGATVGRRYPKDMERPEYIHPSPEPLSISMEKEEQIKKDIRNIINLNISNLNNGKSSAESKQLDQYNLEAGLSFIGMELEQGERQIAEFWSAYLNTNSVATITYPRRYSLRSDADRIDEGKGLAELISIIPSTLYKKEILKQIAAITVGYKVELSTLNNINREIDNAKVLVQDSEIIYKDVEQGLLTAVTASEAKGYPTGEAEKAKSERAERAAQIVAAQTEAAAQARGVPELDSSTSSGKEEKKASRDNSTNLDIGDRTRGEGK